MERLQAAIEKAREQRKSRQPNSNDRVPVSSGPDDPNSVQMAWLELPEIKLRPRSLLHNRVPAFQNGPAAAPYDILRTRFIQQAKANNWRRIAVVSPHSNCGKTTTVVNLGFGLARQGEIRSIALDFDLRRGRLGRLLRQKSSVPMADVLQGQVPFSQVGWRYGEKLIFGMGHGSSPKSSEILQATSTKTVLENIEAAYRPDFMIFDMPPLSASDDNLGFLTQVDAALIVTEAERTTLTQIDVAERQVAELTNVMGVVLNKCRYVSGAYGYEKGYY